MPTVLALGLDPAFVDPTAVAGLSPAVVRAFIDSQLERVRGLGYDLDACLIDPAGAEAVVSDRLRARNYDCVLIGAGLRAPEHLLLFEKVLNIVHALAPGAKICFNSTPADSAEAVRRWTTHPTRR